MVDSSAKGEETPSLSGTTVKYMAKRVLTEFLRDGGTDQAAKLTYFMVLSIAPTLLALFSLATLLLSGIKDQIADLLKQAISSGAGGSGMEVGGAVDSTLGSLMGSATGGTVALIIGIATALWSASAYIKAYGRVANHIYEVPEGRGPIRMNGTMLALTVAMILGILLIAFALISLLYWGAPNIKKPFRFISPGGVFAILGIAVAAVALSIYMGTVAGYSSYGAIGGIMAVLFALWVINIVIIMGAEVDAEYERARELAAGKPAEDSLALPMRDASGAEKAEAKQEKIVDEGRDIRLQNLHHDAEAYTGDDARLTPRHGVPAVDPDSPDSAKDD